MKRTMMILSVAALMAAIMAISSLPAMAQNSGDVNCAGIYVPADVCAELLDPASWDQTLADLCNAGDQLACGQAGPTNATCEDAANSPYNVIGLECDLPGSVPVI